MTASDLYAEATRRGLRLQPLDGGRLAVTPASMPARPCGRATAEQARNP